MVEAVAREAAARPVTLFGDASVVSRVAPDAGARVTGELADTNTQRVASGSLPLDEVRALLDVHPEALVLVGRRSGIGALTELRGHVLTHHRHAGSFRAASGDVYDPYRRAPPHELPAARGGAARRLPPRCGAHRHRPLPCDAMLSTRPEATRVLVSGFDGHGTPSANGHSTPGASWIFTLAELDRAFLATAMNGAPLPPDHGAPLRLLVPGWYGCTCIEWVDRITLVDDDAPATSQMVEFASRTHQDGVPERARDYRPAIIEQAAMPVRVERWRDAEGIALRTTGILRGGSTPTSAASIRFGDAPWEPVTVDPPARQNATWTLWTHTWRPTRRGELPIRMRIDDPAISTRRLDTDHYLRTIVLPA